MAKHQLTVAERKKMIRKRLFAATVAAAAVVAAWFPHGAVLSGTTYYVNVSGSCNNSNDGLSLGNAWCSTGSKSFNSGDIVLVHAGTYSVTWDTGTVTGAAGTYATMKCDTPFACNMSSTSQDGFLLIDSSHWKIQYFNITNATNGGAGITATTNSSSQRDVWIDNNVIYNAKAGNGINVHNDGAGHAFDYVSITSNIVYNSAGSTSAGICNSGISIWEPVNYDTATGTHLLIAGNLSYSNINDQHSGTTYCGTLYTSDQSTLDGEGIIFDTPGPENPAPFTGTTVIERNIVLANGSSGINCTKCTSGPVIIRNNTSWGNNTDAHHFCCAGEITIGDNGSYVETYNNLAVATTATCCASGSFPGNTYGVREPNNGAGTANIWKWNWVVNTAIVNQDKFVGSGSFTWDPSNTFGTDPAFASAAAPGAPNCSGQASVAACLTNVDGAGFNVISKFTPTAIGVNNSGSTTKCASSDITGSVWSGNCDPGAINF